MEAYPRELVEAPRPLIFVLSDDDDGADRLVAALGEHSTSADGAEPRYVRAPLGHKFPKKKDVDVRQRAADGRPLEGYVVRGLLKTAWLRRQFAELPSVVVVVQRVEKLWSGKTGESAEEDEFAKRVESLKASLIPREVRVVVVVVVKGDAPPPRPPVAVVAVVAEPVAYAVVEAVAVPEGGAVDAPGKPVHPLHALAQLPGAPVDDEERGVAALRKRCGLGAACAYALRDGDLAAGADGRRCARVAKGLCDLAAAYYLARARRLKKWDKSLQRGSAAPLLARYAFKTAWFYEFRRDDAKALRHYRAAYAAIADLAQNATGFAAVHPEQIRGAADAANFKICRLALQCESVEDAARQIQRHLWQFRAAPARIPAHAHWGWLARQHVVFAELVSGHRALGPDGVAAAAAAGRPRSNSDPQDFKFPTFSSEAAASTAASAYGNVARAIKSPVSMSALNKAKGDAATTAIATKQAAPAPRMPVGLPTDSVQNSRSVLAYSEPMYHYAAAAAYAVRRRDALSMMPVPDARRFPPDALAKVVLGEAEYVGALPRVSSGADGAGLASEDDRLALCSAALDHAARLFDHASAIANLLHEALLRESPRPAGAPASRRGAWLQAALGDALAHAQGGVADADAARHLIAALAVYDSRGAAWARPRAWLREALLKCALRLGDCDVAAEASLALARPDARSHVGDNRAIAAQRDALRLLARRHDGDFGDSADAAVRGETLRFRGFDAAFIFGESRPAAPSQTPGPARHALGDSALVEWTARFGESAATWGDATVSVELRLRLATPEGLRLAQLVFSMSHCVDVVIEPQALGSLGDPFYASTELLLPGLVYVWRGLANLRGAGAEDVRAAHVELKVCVGCEEDARSVDVVAPAAPTSTLFAAQDGHAAVSVSARAADMPTLAVVDAPALVLAGARTRLVLELVPDARGGGAARDVVIRVALSQEGAALPEDAAVALSAAPASAADARSSPAVSAGAAVLELVVAAPADASADAHVFEFTATTAATLEASYAVVWLRVSGDYDAANVRVAASIAPAAGAPTAVPASVVLHCAAPFTTTWAPLGARQTSHAVVELRPNGECRWIGSLPDEFVDGAAPPMRAILRGVSPFAIRVDGVAHSAAPDKNVLRGGAHELLECDELAVDCPGAGAAALVVHWAVASSAGDVVATTVRLGAAQSGSALRPALSCSAAAPAAAALAAPFVAAWRVENHTDAPLCLRCTAAGGEAYAWAGKLDAQLELAPREARSLEFAFVPLLPGRHALPRLRFTASAAQQHDATTPPVLVFVNP